jgi:hypothetical protein
MLPEQVKVGTTYSAKVDKKRTTIRLDEVRCVECWIDYTSYMRLSERTTYIKYVVTNLKTDQRAIFDSTAYWAVV